MRNLLALLGAAVLTFAALGWYLGWYSFQSAAGTADGHRSVTIDVNTRKIGADIRTGGEKLQGAIDRVTREEESEPPAPANKPSR